MTKSYSIVVGNQSLAFQYSEPGSVDVSSDEWTKDKFIDWIYYENQSSGRTITFLEEDYPLILNSKHDLIWMIKNVVFFQSENLKSILWMVLLKNKIWEHILNEEKHSINNQLSSGNLYKIYMLNNGQVLKVDNYNRYGELYQSANDYNTFLKMNSSNNSIIIPVKPD